MTDPRPSANPDKQLTQRLDIDFALQAAGLGVWEVDPLTKTVNWDDRCQELFGLAKDNRLPYEQAIRYIHPDDVEGVDQAVQRAIDPQSGEPYDRTYRTIGTDDGQLRWVRFTGRSTFNDAGEVIRFSGIAQDVTEQVTSRQLLQEREAYLQLLENTVPAMIFYLDAQERYLSYNETFMRWFGVDKTQALGKTVREFIGEVAYQAVLPHLTIAYSGQQTQYELFAPSRMGEERWLTITYIPHKTATGRVLGLIVHATDITSNKQAELALRASVTDFRNAVELAELGNWSVDVATSMTTLSPRLASWFGFEALMADADSFIACIAEEDQDRVSTSLFNTLSPGSDGRYDEVHTIVNAKSGHRRIVHAMGRVYANAAGQPAQIKGTAQDITAQRELQLLLEQQVQERTEELAAANEELAASNEELLVSYEEVTSTNEQIIEANYLLSRSNENLQQFAYVASHDLQEPLRKIQSFGELLNVQYGDQLGEGALYIQRMQVAATRMSTLIQDLLAFSRISTKQDSRQPTSLNQVVDLVLSDLDMLISETGTRIQVGTLPTLNGDAPQLGQLFQNLLSNAIKFRRSDTPSVVSIHSTRIAFPDLPTDVIPLRQASYYSRIDVIDNGIGFDQKYAYRIFQVFQRLHGKQHYAGTGIGLAICEKVVINHGGAITASSQLGQGATFSIYLPEER